MKSEQAMLINRQNSFLLVIDIQARLAPAIEHSADVIERNRWLLDIATEMCVPTVVAEQYPKGLGHTVEDLQTSIKAAQVMEKTHFSALQDASLAASIHALNRPQVVLTGTEAHVCVLQTALDLIVAGFQVFVVADAVGSRQVYNKELALQRMRYAGCQVVSSEMVAYEWLHKSDTDEFRHISKTYLR